MEGKKAYILPVLAALVLGGLLLLRPDTSQDEQSERSSAVPTQAPGTSSSPPVGVKATIRAALAEVPDARLSQSARTRVHEALGAVVERCRASRPESATPDISISIEVIAAEGVGTRVEAARLNGSPNVGAGDDETAISAGLVGCVREGVLGSKLADVDETGRATWTLEFDAS